MASSLWTSHGSSPRPQTGSKCATAPRSDPLLGNTSPRRDTSGRSGSARAWSSKIRRTGHSVGNAREHERSLDNTFVDHTAQVAAIDVGVIDPAD
mmetsp:Transcript_14647/g.31831  ORF Transcript_14647/g.31831 Transcript_14647/m.31831 type:complete len:95 (+) Transcript_14647:202-486(+)